MNVKKALNIMDSKYNKDDVAFHSDIREIILALFEPEESPKKDPIKEVYDRMKHLDCLFSDKQWLNSDAEESGGVQIRMALYDMWQAICAHVEGGK